MSILDTIGPYDTIKQMTQKRKIIELVILSAILCFAFYMAYIPHLDYPYPIHIDEWYHYGMSQSLLEEGGLSFVEPFFGERTIEDHPEVGYHLFLSQIKLFTGLSWLDIFRFLPSFIFAFTAFMAYIFGRRSNFGLEAAFFVALIPTTLRILGPSFLVPVALGISLLPLILFLLHYLNIGVAKAFLLFLLLSFTFLMHPPTGVAVSLVMGIYAVMLALGRRKERGWWHSPALILATMSLPWLTIVLRYSPQIAESMRTVGEARSYFLPLVYGAFEKFGYLPLALFVLGILLLTLRWKARNWSLVLSSAAFLGILFLFVRVHVGVPIMYDRGWMYFFLMAGIIAAFATREVYQRCREYLSPHIRKAPALALFLVLVLMVASAFQGIQNRLEEPYYHIIGKGVYFDLLWIRENLDDSYQRAVVAPHLAIAFTPLSGKFIYASSAATQIIPEKVLEVEEFFSEGGINTEWLREKQIDIIYSQKPIENPDLEKVAEHIYIMRR